jgi:hypothetical protein
MEGGLEGLTAVDVPRCVTEVFDGTGDVRGDDDADRSVLDDTRPTTKAETNTTTTNNTTRPTAASRRRRICARRCSLVRVDRCAGPSGLTGTPWIGRSADADQQA